MQAEQSRLLACRVTALLPHQWLPREENPGVMASVNHLSEGSKEKIIVLTKICHLPPSSPSPSKSGFLASSRAPMAVWLASPDWSLIPGWRSFKVFTLLAESQRAPKHHLDVHMCDCSSGCRLCLGWLDLNVWTLLQAKTLQPALIMLYFVGLSHHPKPCFSLPTQLSSWVAGGVYCSSLSCPLISCVS